MSVESGHTHEPDAGKRLLMDVAGAILTCIVAFGLYGALFSEEAGFGLFARALLCGAVGALFTEVAGVRLFRAEAAVRGLPLSRFSAGAGAIFFSYLGIQDLFLHFQIPLYPAGFYLAGAMLLAASVWADSVLAALAGAEFLDRSLALGIATWFGFPGGMGTQAIFFYLAISLLELPLGYFLATRFRRSLGLGVFANAGLSVVACLLYLGSYGPAFHDQMDWLWLHYVYFALSIVFCIGFVRMVRKFTKGAVWDLSSRTVILTFSYIAGWMGAPSQTAFLIGMMCFWVLESSGIFKVEDDEPQLAITPDMLQDPARLGALLQRLAHVDPISGRMPEARQLRWTRGAVLLSLVTLLGVSGVGLANRSLPSAESFRLTVFSETIARDLKVDVEKIHLPDGLRPGEPLEAYLTAYGVHGSDLVFTDMHVLRPGEPPPEDVDPETAWKVTGRAYVYRDFQGKGYRGFLPHATLRYRLPEAWADGARDGDVLVFRKGWAGYGFAAEWLPADRDDGDPGDPPDDPERRELPSWLLEWQGWSR